MEEGCKPVRINYLGTKWIALTSISQ
jgi:hypothetical protein